MYDDVFSVNELMKDHEKVINDVTCLLNKCHETRLNLNENISNLENIMESAIDNDDMNLYQVCTVKKNITQNTIAVYEMYETMYTKAIRAMSFNTNINSKEEPRKADEELGIQPIDKECV